MTLVALGGMPLFNVGGTQFDGSIGTSGTGGILMDAANEASITIGQIFTDDGASHTIDTTGSSSMGWLSGAVTFANAGSTVKVGLAAVDTATGPPGRAVNVADVITFDVSKSLTGGGGGIAASAWNEHVPDTGTKTIANGALVAFCQQMTARAGVDAVNTNGWNNGAFNRVFPHVIGFTGGAYTVTTRIPNCVITFSDGHLGFFYGGSVVVSSTGQAWNNTSGNKEYGNFFQLPFPASIVGIISTLNQSGDADWILYSDPLGTPAVQATVSRIQKTVLAAQAGYSVALFTTPYSAAANQPLAGIIKPTSASNVTLAYKSMNASAHQKSDTLGTNCYAVNRNTGAFAAQNASKDRFALGLLVGAFDGGGGVAGLPASRLQLGH